MSTDKTIVVLLLAAGWLLTSEGSIQREISVKDSIAAMIAGRPARVLYTPSIAYESELRDKPQERIHFLDDQRFERQVELLLAEVQCQLTGTKEAQKFFVKASVFGLPSYDSLRFFDDFILSYDARLKQPIWSLELLKPGNYVGVRANMPSRRTRSLPDKSVERMHRSNFRDYKDTQYDRCHLAATLHRMFNQKTLIQAYRMTNTAPQAISLNQPAGVWSRLDEYVAHLAGRSKNTYVLTGSVYKPQKDRRDLRYGVIGLNRVAVPTHFYKVILSESKKGNTTIELFAMPNSQRVTEMESLERFRIDISYLDTLEEVTGLRMFDIIASEREFIPNPGEFLHDFKESRPSIEPTKTSSEDSD